MVEGENSQTGSWSLFESHRPLPAALCIGRSAEREVNAAKGANRKGAPTAEEEPRAKWECSGGGGSCQLGTRRVAVGVIALSARRILFPCRGR